MESDEKVKIIERAVRKVMEEEEEEESFPKALQSDEKSSSRRRQFLSELLCELESMEGVINVAEEVGNSEIIIKEIGKVQRQNVMTQWLVSAMIMLTFAWQLSEVSLIFKIKHALTNPLKSLGGLFFKNNNRDMSEKQTSLKIPDVEFPGFHPRDDDDA